MPWSWNDPSPDDAEEAYQYYRGKYYEAANQRAYSQKQEDAYRSQRSSAKKQISSLSGQKSNFEERLKQIDDIIRMMEGRGGWFTTNVPEVISKAQKSLSKADESYRGAIRLVGGAAAASLANAFDTKDVEAEAHSSSALQQFRAEYSRLEQEIENVNREISRLSDMVSSLSSQINACNEEQAALRSRMNSSAYDMNHYKNYTY